MTIDEARRFVNIVANKDRHGGVTPDEFNLLAKNAQQELILKKYYNEKRKVDQNTPIYGYGSTQKSIDDLSPFLRKESITLQNEQSDLPEDYMHLDACITKSDEPIDMMSNDKYRYRLKSHLLPPSEEFPIGCLIEKKIEVKGVDEFFIFYLRLPKDPVWGFNIVDNIEKYDATKSTQFELPADCHNEICFLILQNIGINIDYPTLVQYSQQKEALGV